MTAAFLLPSLVFADQENSNFVVGSVVNPNQGLFVMDSFSESSELANIGLFLRATTTDAVITNVRITCFATTTPVASQTGCTDTTPRDMNETDVTVTLSGTGAVYFFDFSSTTDPFVLQAGKTHVIEIFLDTGDSIDVLGGDVYEFAGQCDYNGAHYMGCVAAPFYITNRQFYFADADPLFESYFSGQDATSTLADLAGRCSQAGNIFAEGLCAAGVFLFVPAPETISEFTNLRLEMETKFPFSFFFQAQDVLEGLEYQATTSEFSLDLHSLGLGSTTPIGNVLPASVVLFSQDTIEQFLPDWVWPAGQALIAATLWVALGLDIYATVRRRHAHT